jgi:hypothetical protein
MQLRRPRDGQALQTFPLFYRKIRATEDFGSTASASKLLILLLSESKFRAGRAAEFFPLFSGISGELKG